MSLTWQTLEDSEISTLFPSRLIKNTQCAFNQGSINQPLRLEFARWESNKQPINTDAKKKVRHLDLFHTSASSIIIYPLSKYSELQVVKNPPTPALGLILVDPLDNSIIITWNFSNTRLSSFRAHIKHQGNGLSESVCLRSLSCKQQFWAR